MSGIDRKIFLYVLEIYVRILSKYSDLLVLKYNLWCAYSSDLLVLIYILWFWQEEMFELDRKQCLDLTGRNVLDVVGVYFRILSKYSDLLVLMYNLWCAYSSDLLVLAYIIWVGLVETIRLWHLVGRVETTRLWHLWVGRVETIRLWHLGGPGRYYQPLTHGRR